MIESIHVVGNRALVDLRWAPFVAFPLFAAPPRSPVTRQTNTSVHTLNLKARARLTRVRIAEGVADRALGKLRDREHGEGDR